MAFKGLLFIGIDRYAPAEINWMSCATRDTTALHPLFADNLGGDTTLLMDGQATVAAIRERLEQLATGSPDDIVVIAFSGHGTETHELVAHDTDPYDLARTSITASAIIRALLRANSSTTMRGRMRATSHCLTSSSSAARIAFC